MKFWRKRRLQGFLLILPFFLLFLLFVAYPFVSTVIQSFVSTEGPLANYQALFQTAGFGLAMHRTILYTVLSAIIATAVAVPIAFQIHQFIRKHDWIMAQFALPFSSGMIGLAAIWMMLFSNAGNQFYKILPMFGATGSNWLDEEGTAFCCILMLFVWRNLAFMLHSLLNSLDSIPSITSEAALIAGASHTQFFRYIALPQITPCLAYVVPMTIVSVITAFEPFVLMNIAGASDVSGSIYMLFDQIRFSGNAGISCALCTLLILPVLLCCILYARFFQRNGKG